VILGHFDTATKQMDRESKREEGTDPVVSTVSTFQHITRTQLSQKKSRFDRASFASYDQPCRSVFGGYEFSGLLADTVYLTVQ
jgi:hypothetical protein